MGHALLVVQDLRSCCFRILNLSQTLAVAVALVAIASGCDRESPLHSDICGQGCPPLHTCLPSADSPSGFDCVFEHTALCTPCNTDDACVTEEHPEADTRCLALAAPKANGSKFCATRCTLEKGDNACPQGYLCTEHILDEANGVEHFCQPSSQPSDESNDEREDPQTQAAISAAMCTCSAWAIQNEASTECIAQNTWGQCTGVQQCSQEGLSACNAPMPSEDICNNQDDNCDGSIDERFLPGGAVQFVSAAQNKSLGKNEACGVGACALGQVICDDTGMGLQCSTASLASPERCDGIDNDCNGSIDDGLVPPVAAMQLGICQGAVKVCAGSQGWQEPNLVGLRPGFEPQEVSCDGIDNDCNGLIDDIQEPPHGRLALGICAQTRATCAGNAGWQDPDYAALLGNYQDVENRCDGIDNDCDGEIDEPFLDPLAAHAWRPEHEREEDGLDEGEGEGEGEAGLPPGLPLGAACGAGQCQGGTIVCAESQDALFCTSEPEATTELCDGIDNDCNGSIDDISNPPLFGSQLGVCTDLRMVCAGEAGWQEPSLGDIAQYQADETLCDGIDNNCDGIVDEPFLPGGTRSLDQSDVGGLANLTLGQACGVGTCTGGLVVCGADGQTLACNSDAQSTDELCDGIDNDCNGHTDDSLIPPLGDKQQGVCAQSQKICFGEASWIEPDYNRIAAGYESVERTCDSIDNDCDGNIDEIFAQGGSITLQDLNGQEGLVLGDACGVGRCDGGQVVCGETGTLLACTSHDQVQVEICNGIDDDCDGSIDEDLQPPLAQEQRGVCAQSRQVCRGSEGWADPDPSEIAHHQTQETLCDGRDNDCDGLIDSEDPDVQAPLAENQRGVCEGAVQHCAGSQGWQPPRPQSIPSFELFELSCDERDNDCDGEVDEFHGLGGGVKFPDLQGNLSLIKGDACGVGSCQGGVVACGPLLPPSKGEGEGEAQPNGLVCTSAGQASPELCDGIDNDCDGITDEGLIPPLADQQEGLCVSSRKQCLGALGWAEPAYANIPGYQANETACDGRDNDCDGSIDENQGPEGAISYQTERDPTPRYKGDSCGIGQCGGGQVVCASNALELECTGDLLAGDEVCDGLDNDCDGNIDEDLTPPNNPNQNGACYLSAMRCHGEAGWVEDYTAIPTYGLPETPDTLFADENCDGIDGDLNLAVLISSAGADLFEDTQLPNLECSLQRPCRTLTYGIERARALNKPHIYVQAGNYLETIHIPSAEPQIQIYGGYSMEWERNLYTTEGHGVRIVGVAGDPTQPIAALIARETQGTLENLILQAPVALGQHATGSGRSSHGIWAHTSTLTLQRIHIDGGQGAPGIQGTPGIDQPGVAPAGRKGGDSARPGSTCNSGSRGRGGAPVSQPACGDATRGGGGGDGGTQDDSCSFPPDLDATGGRSGGHAAVSGSGHGAPGSGGGRCRAGNPGQSGREIHGQPGLGGSSEGRLDTDGAWLGTFGAQGGLGEHGGGGGGGGGSGGCDTGTDSYGAGGGSGGAGGCRATQGGSGGAPGGAAINILAIDSSIDAQDLALQLGQGGQGGQGGRGGQGQTGGSPGAGGNRSGNNGPGGQGGRGGNGGHAGGGGGGGGGPAVGILQQGGSLALEAMHYIDGEGGQGGASGPAAGAGGAAGEVGADGRHEYVWDLKPTQTASLEANRR